MADLNLGDLFATCSSAWRLCARDTYMVDEEGEALAAWRRTGRLTPRPDGWIEILTEARARGARFARVQILRPPLSMYAGYLLAVYEENLGQGEDIRIAVSQRGPSAEDLPREDFWIFDDATVALMDYDRDGRFLGVRDASSSIEAYRRAQGAAAAASMPLLEWLSTAPAVGY